MHTWILVPRKQCSCNHAAYTIELHDAAGRRGAADVAKARSHAATWETRTLVEREGAVGVAGALHWPAAALLLTVRHMQ